MTRRAPNSSRPVRPSSTPARRKGIPLIPLAQQMLQDMQLAGLAERTHESYLRAVRKFAQWLNKSPQVATEPCVYRAMTVTAEEFIRRFLQHVLPRGFQKVRHYGFAHPWFRLDREWLNMLVTVALSFVYVLLVAAQPLPVPHRPCCPNCGAS